MNFETPCNQEVSTMTYIYKLTDKSGKTRAGYNNCLDWSVPGTQHEATGLVRELCTDGLLHGYVDPLLAVFMDPIHGRYLSSPGARMFKLKTNCELVREGQLKCGVRSTTVVEEIPVPVVTTVQRVKFAIYCAAAAMRIEL